MPVQLPVQNGSIGDLLERRNFTRWGARARGG